MTNSTMKKRNYLLGILIVVCSVLIVLGAILPIGWRIERANGQVAAEISQEILEEYAFGDKFVIPECTFTQDGKSAQGVASLQYPNGAQTSKAEVSLNQSGNYVLRYIAEIDEKVYTKEYTFRVYGRLASYESEKTTMEYGVCTHLGANSEGLMVKIANGDALTFDHVFDMTKMTMSTKLLEGFVVPNVQGAADFSRMVFTFTDVEDPSVQLVYYGNFHNDSNAYGLTFFTAAGNGQIQCGLEHVGKLHVGSTLGCMVPHSFLAMDTGLYYGAQQPQAATPDAKIFCISYDYKTNQAWAGGKIISDLDDNNYYSSLWFGFPSGKAKLTISALNYNDATANMCFTSILGVDLSAESYVDDEKPIITIDNDYETMPNAVVGGSYPVSVATAYDRVSGACDVNVSVWYNYGSDTQKMIDVKDGRFAVEQVGVYAIVYQATDHSGNTSKEILWVRAHLKQYLPKLTVSLGDIAQEIEVGMLQTLSEATVSGGCGKVTLTYSLKNGENECEIIDGTFRLEQAGSWVLTCTATDYVGNEAKVERIIQGVVGEKPILHENPVFPSAYISGATYSLPLIYAYDYSNGGKAQKLCNVTVTYGEETATYTAGETFTPTVLNNQDTVKISYTSGETILFEQDVPVCIVFSRERIPGATERYRDAVNVEKYFTTQDDLSFVNNYALESFNGLKISTNSATESAKTFFANPQSADAFSLSFLTVPGKSTFQQLNVTLTDSEDSNISVKATLQKSEGQTKMLIGDTELALLFDFDGAQAVSYSIGFEGTAFIVNETATVAVSKTEKGAPFNGFPSHKVYFSIEMCDAQADATIFLNKLCGINVNNTRDNTGPFLTTEKSVTTNALKDSVYTVQKMIACDVLCPNVKAYVTVVAPNGSPVVTLDGITLENVDATKEYQIRLDEYGEYLINVTATEDESWKFSTISYFDYAVTVIDGEKPTLTFKGNFQSTIKVGELLVIPDYTVSDNFTKAEDITVIKMIINPKGMPVYMYEDSKAIKCEYAGVYKIYFYVYDQMGNLTTFETSVTVK